MDHLDLTGYYTYRSFHNRPEPDEDFNLIRFEEGELFLWVAPEGAITGTLAFPADPLATGKEFMDISGQVTGWSPVALELHGVGRPGTGTAGFDYRYHAVLAPTDPDAIGQRPALVGTVLRARPHGEAPAGFTASIVAVRRDFLRPREIPGAALIPNAVTMLASRRHRLQHAVWHTVRMLWHTINADSDAVAKIQDLGWWPQRPPFLPTRALNLENGAGEDFLYMHRKMIRMFHDTYATAGVTAPPGWSGLPAAAAPQTVFHTTAPPGSKGFEFDPDASGFMVPPPAKDDGDRMIKSPTFLTTTMQPLAALYRSPTFLSALPLGRLGNLLEFTIHGWMHVRWTHTVYDPKTGDPVGRSSLFDVDPKWDTPTNDDLGDFYSSHVHPTFWRLHSWIDDRVNDWATANAGRISPTTVGDVPWFATDGKLVQVSEPFYWPTSDHHHHHKEPGPGNGDVEVMEEVLETMRKVVEAPQAQTEAVGSLTAVRFQPARLAFRNLFLDVAGLS